MTKIHGNKKREYKLAAHKNHEKFFQGVVRARRPRTFNTEEAANKYAETHKIGAFELKKVKKNKRFQIVSKESKPEIKVEASAE